MSRETTTGVYIFHTDLGPMVVALKTVERYDVEDIIRQRAISQARTIQFLNLGKKTSPNDPRGERTISSIFSGNEEVLPS